MTEMHKPRRDFLFVTTGAIAALGGAAFAWPLVKQMSPAPDSLLKHRVYVDLSKLEEGMEMRVLYRGRPVAIRYRTPAEIKAAEADDMADMVDPQTDRERLRPKPDGSYDPRFLAVYPLCTHFGCVVIGESGRYDGWYCPCHGANFDTSGRVRTAPAPRNLEIPDYFWDSETVLVLR